MPPPSQYVSDSISPYRSMIVWGCAVLVGLTSLGYFVNGIPDEPVFVDESAYYSQSYYAKLFAQRKRDDPAWLEYMAYDLPPLPKYLIGASLWHHGYPFPTADQARSWYQNTSLRFDPKGALAAARLPFAALGAFGCVALFGIGVLAFGVRAGLIASFLLAINPLYAMHSRRAMSDVPCEAFMIAALFVSLWAWTRWLKGHEWHFAAFAPIVAGAFAGLALLSKLSGTLALMVIAAWCLLGFLANGSLWRKFGNAASNLLTPAAAIAVFFVFNPYLTAQPKKAVSANLAGIAAKSLTERADMMFRLRFQVASDQQSMFSHNALHRPGEKLSVMAVQGFGRFGPLGRSPSDSTIRFDTVQDYGALIWLPCVALGLIWAVLKGWTQRDEDTPPTAWAIATYWIVTAVVVTSYLPMAWDRYMLSIQGPSCLIAGGFFVAAIDAALRLVNPRLKEV